MLFLVVFSENIFFKTQGTRLHTTATSSKCLELAHVIPFHGQSLLMKENAI